MPIQQTLPLRTTSNDEFTHLDAIVMRCAYASQNRFGRYFDERVYENDLASRLRSEGIPVHTQVPVVLTHDGFEKIYYLDLIVNQMIYELKVARSLTEEHDAQLLNYAMLHDVATAKLINFGEPKVRGKLLRNALTREERYLPTSDLTHWAPIGRQCEILLNYLTDLIRDWGTHLDYRLYNEALVHFFGGLDKCVRRMDILNGNMQLGSQYIQLHGPKIAFVVTGFTKRSEGYRKHLRVLLEHLPSFQGIQWLNLNHSCLEATTILPTPTT